MDEETKSLVVHGRHSCGCVYADQLDNQAQQRNIRNESKKEKLILQGH
jgi:hypothetical protein